LAPLGVIDWNPFCQPLLQLTSFLLPPISLLLLIQWRRWRSVITSKPLPDFNNTLVKRVETSMKALVVKSKYVAQYH
jgi:hypothetical protein